MSNYFQNNSRVFGKDFQNIFNFLNKPNNIKKVSVNSQNENLAQVFKKPKVQKNNYGRRNTMYMKISNFPLQNINNKENENKSSLFVIKEEKENVPATRKSMINLNDANAVTKGAVNKNKIKEDKIEVKDYFHSLVDEYGDDIFR